MTKIKVTQVKSTIKLPEKQVRIMESLGLRKINSSNVLPLNKAVLGMVKAVSHLIKVEEVTEQ